MIKEYCFAGVGISVDIPDDIMYEEDRRMAPFRVEKNDASHCFTFRLAEHLDAPAGPVVTVQPGFRVYRDAGWELRYFGSVQERWEPAYARAAHKGEEHFVQLKADAFPGKVATTVVLNALAAEHLIAEAGGVVLHSSFVEWNGKAILFTAPSGTGKSTQAELWRSLRSAGIINGDRAAIRVLDGVPYACGIPFAGSSQYSENRELPLAAVVYLAQAPVTTITRLKGYAAFARIWEGCSVNTWSSEDMERSSGLVSRIAGTVPVYELACTPDESAVVALENALKGA
jgi:hypothetical protein